MIKNGRFIRFLVVMVFSVGLLFTGWGQSTAQSIGSAADLVLKNGCVYTADAKDTMAEAVAVKDSKIVFVGSAQEAEWYVGDKTQVIDLAGKMVMPGMIDSHIHAPGTTLAELYSINLYGILRENETMDTIKKFVEEHPDLDAYYGEGFSIRAFGGQETALGPKKERLDEICPDKPMIIVSYDGHTTWVNSKALEMAGITKDSKNPTGGVIEKDPKTGEPWGTLKEAAANLVPQQEFTAEQKLEAMKAFQDQMHAWGYTGLISITGSSSMPPVEDYKALEDKGELKLRVNTSMTIDPQKDLAPQFEELKKLRDNYHSDLIQVRTAKFFADGVIKGVTAWLLQPYTAETGKGSNYRGTFLWDINKMKEAFKIANSAGIQVHVHSIGDASTRNVLNAMKYAKANVPEGDYRNAITHLQLVAPEDILRFKELGVVAVPQIYWHLKEPEWWEVVDFPFLGERAEHEYPLQSFIKAGVVVAGASDHPPTIR